MNKKIILGIIIAVVLILVVLSSQKENEPKKYPETSYGWVKYDNNPVLASGPDSAWNKFKTDPTVIKDADLYKMWFGTGKGDSTTIAYAISLDGINWQIHPESVLLPDNSSWEGKDLETPTVLIDNQAPSEQRYKMWYTGFENQETYRIGYAVSPDGVKWTKYEGNPVLDIGDKTKFDWDGWTVADPVVLKDKGLYKMWFSGAGEVPAEKTWHFWIGYATSQDGINWEKYSGNPVLDIGLADSFESRAVGQPTVLYNGEFYELWYSGWDEIDKSWSSQIGYATSPDGIKWTKSAENPVLGKGEKGSWDSDQLVANTVLLDDGKYKMWYTGMKVDTIIGMPINMHIGIGFAEKNRKGQ